MQVLMLGRKIFCYTPRGLKWRV